MKKIFWVILLAFWAINLARLSNDLMLNVAARLNFQVGGLTPRLLMIIFFVPLIEELIKFGAFRLLYQRYIVAWPSGLGVAILFGILERVTQGSTTLVALLDRALVSAPHGIFFIPVAILGPGKISFLLAAVGHVGWNWMTQVPWPWKVLGLFCLLGLLSWPYFDLSRKEAWARGGTEGGDTQFYSREAESL